MAANTIAAALVLCGVVAMSAVFVAKFATAAAGVLPTAVRPLNQKTACRAYWSAASTVTARVSAVVRLLADLVVEQRGRATDHLTQQVAFGAMTVMNVLRAAAVVGAGDAEGRPAVACACSATAAAELVGSVALGAAAAPCQCLLAERWVEREECTVVIDFVSDAARLGWYLVGGEKEPWG